MSRINAQFAALNKRFDNLEKRNVSGAQAPKNCGTNLGEYTMTEYPFEKTQSIEHVAYMGNPNRMNNPYSNTYNPN